MLGTTFSKCWLVVGFAINQKTIAATLCENRNKPELSCHGKCYLRKQMANEERQENAALGNSGKEKFEVVVPDQAAPSVVATARLNPTSFPIYKAAILQQEPVSIFHPPQV
jgi:hypothetical protein